MGIEQIKKIEISGKTAGVQTLAVRPNQPSSYGQGSLSAKQLQEKFDHLADAIIKAYNELCDILADPGKAATYIAWETGKSLQDFFDTMGSGELAERIKTTDPEFGNEYISITAAIGKISEGLKEVVNYIDILDGSTLFKDYVNKWSDEEQTIKSDLTSEGTISATHFYAGGIQVDGTSTFNETATFLKGLYSEADINADGLIKGESIETKGNATIGGEISAATVAASANITAKGDVRGKDGSFSHVYARGADIDGLVRIGENTLSGIEVYGSSTMSDVDVTDLNVRGNASVSGSLNITGDLRVEGTTTTVNIENSTVRDNVIVVNAGTNGAAFENSGIVINTGEDLSDSQYVAYGILYQPQGDAVYIGLGTLTYSEDGYDFSFNDGQAIPLAARSGSFETDDIPVWDADSNSFVSSGAKLGDIEAALDRIIEIQNSLIGG